MEVGNFLSRFSNRIEEWTEKIDGSSSTREKQRHEQEMAEYIIKCMPFMQVHAQEEEDGLNASREKTTENAFGVVETKGLARKDIYEDYLVDVEGANVTRPAKRRVDVCPHCGDEGTLVHDAQQSEIVCSDCGTIVATLLSEELTYREEQESTSKITQYSYRRSNHFNEWITQFCGNESTQIPDDILDSLRAELKKQRIESASEITHTRVRALLKKLRLNKYYEHTPHITNLLSGIRAPQMSAILEERLRMMFNEIQTPFDKVCPKGRKNFLSYSYTIYKMLELLGEDMFLPFLPLLKSREKLTAQDCIWRAICAELQWEFIPTT